MKDFLSVIRASQLFSGISEDELTAMLTCLDTRQTNFPKDTFLMRVGNTADSIGLLLEGSALIIQEDIWAIAISFQKRDRDRPLQPHMPALPDRC